MKTEAELTLMLVRRAVARWRLDTGRLLQLAGSWSASRRRLAVVESGLMLDQIKSLVRRIQPLTKSGDVAIRREAQGMLVALDAIRDRLGSVVEDVGAKTAADEIRAAVFAPLRLRSGAGEHRRSDAPASGAFVERRSSAPGQVTRFEPRYIDYLTGRGPDRAASRPAATSTPTEQDPARSVLDTAYLLWEQDGQPSGQADIYWRQALERHWTERAWADANDIDDVPPEQRRLEAEAAAPAPEIPELQEDRDSAPGSSGEGRQAYQEVVDAFAELAATLVGLANELDLPPVPPSRPQSDRTDQGDGASISPTRRDEEERALKQGRYIRGRGVVSGGDSAEPAGPAGSDPSRLHTRMEPQLRPRPKKLPPRPKKKGWGGA